MRGFDCSETVKLPFANMQMLSTLDYNFRGTVAEPAEKNKFHQDLKSKHRCRNKNNLPQFLVFVDLGICRPSLNTTKRVSVDMTEYVR
jgi:hypothetical protein